MSFDITEQEIKKLGMDIQQQALVARRIKKEMNKIQDKRLRMSAAQYILFHELRFYLDEVQKSAPWTVEKLKESMKLRMQIFLAEILSLVDTYPNLEGFDEFTKKGLIEYGNWARNSGRELRI